MHNTIEIIDCRVGEHAKSVQQIINHAIVHTTALYDYTPRDIESLVQWFAVKEQKQFPILGAFNQQGDFLGFATYGTFRDKDGFKLTVEHSVYVDHQYRGKGVGKLLMHELIARAQLQGYHVMIGAIDAENKGSIRFHEQFGFAPCGLIREVGFKFDKWLDLAFYQLILNHH